MTRRLGTFAAATGAGLVLTTNLLGGTGIGALAFAAWALVPYALLGGASRVATNPWIIAGAGTIALAIETGIRASVFLFPRGSTAAIALVFSPAYITVVGLPGGAIAGWLAGSLWRTGSRVLRAVVVTASIASIALIVVGFGRPDMFPTTVARRHAILERIGEPRIVAGADAFDVVEVSKRATWVSIGPFDGEGGGEEIALVSGRGADLLDPVDFHVRGHVPFSGEMPRRWNWFSVLIRFGNGLAVAQTGGGFQDTELRRLDGERIWAYRPDPDLAPSAMKAADLDGDGRVEFYASDAKGIVRLDEAGREVWRRDAALHSVTHVEPRDGATPAWIVATRYGEKVRVWDDRGDLLAARADIDDFTVAGVVEWPVERRLVFGATTAKGAGLTGAPDFSIPLGDFTLTSAISVRATAAGGRQLVLTASAPRDVKRWRLLVVSPTREIVFDEILAAPVRLAKVRRPEGGETLLVVGNGVRALRPKEVR